MRRLVLLVVAVLTISVALASPAVAAQADPGQAEAEFVDLINALRSSKGLSTLEVHGELVALGRSWARSMADVDRISHNPGLADAVDADWEKLGENVGVGMTVDKLHRAFIASPTHYKNLVDPAFTHLGVGVVVGRDGALFTSHQFMQLREPAAATITTAATIKTAATTTTTTTTTPPRPASRPATTATTAVAPPPAAAAPEPGEVVVAALPPARLVLVLEQLRALDLR